MALNAVLDIPGFDRLSWLGEGGFGRVYRAFRKGESVAVKVMTKEGAQPIDHWRFQREFEVLVGLDHPALPQVFERGTSAGNPYYTMEVIEGQELLTFLRDRPEELESVFEQLFNAVAYLHQNGVVHRDLKPENILVQADGRVRLLDFGLAREKSVRLTRTGSVVGTPAYMAPEQILGEAVDERTDLYSIGVILYEALAGHLPFETRDVPAMMYKIVHESAAPLQTPHACLVHWLMQKKPSQRPASAELAWKLWNQGCTKRSCSLSIPTRVRSGALPFLLGVGGTLLASWLF